MPKAEYGLVHLLSAALTRHSGSQPIFVSLPLADSFNILPVSSIKRCWFRKQTKETTKNTITTLQEAAERSHGLNQHQIPAKSLALERVYPPTTLKQITQWSHTSPRTGAHFAAAAQPSVLTKTSPAEKWVSPKPLFHAAQIQFLPQLYSPCGTTLCQWLIYDL